MTYERLVQTYLNRIGAYDKAGPSLNAVIAINRRALDIARARDEERRKTGRRSPLHGIPIAIKDNIDTYSDADNRRQPRVRGSSGPNAMPPSSRGSSAPARSSSSRPTSTNWQWAPRGSASVGGQVAEPVRPGTESWRVERRHGVRQRRLCRRGYRDRTGRSIRGPATNNSIVGIATTQGLRSRAGVIPISFTQDRVGAHGGGGRRRARAQPPRRGIDPEDLFTSESLGRDEASPLPGRSDDDRSMACVSAC